MIHYEPGRWGLLFALKREGSVFPKAFALALPCSVLSMVCHQMMRWRYGLDDYVGASKETITIFAGFTSILGFLIVFRSNQAYSRWWEGGSLLQQIRGDWFNAYSNLLSFCTPLPDRADEVQAFQHRLVRLMSLLYGFALEQVSTMDGPFEFELIELTGFDPESLQALTAAHDKCEVVLQWIQRVIVQQNASEVILIAPPILSRVYNQLGNGIVNLNNARKITEFPIPYPLAQMVTAMLVCHWFFTLFLCAVFIERMAMAGVLVFLVVGSFWGINYIAIELEMPFGDDPNDLPLGNMHKDFNRSLVSLLLPEFGNAPKYNFQADIAEQLTCEMTDFESHVQVVTGEIEQQSGTESTAFPLMQELLSETESCVRSQQKVRRSIKKLDKAHTGGQPRHTLHAIRQSHFSQHAASDRGDVSPISSPGSSPTPAVQSTTCPVQPHASSTRAGSDSGGQELRAEPLNGGSSIPVERRAYSDPGGEAARPHVVIRREASEIVYKTGTSADSYGRSRSGDSLFQPIPL